VKTWFLKNCCVQIQLVYRYVKASRDAEASGAAATGAEQEATSKRRKVPVTLSELKRRIQLTVGPLYSC
jgi:hypothetical protein